MAIVYTHSKPNGDIFYIGIGVSKKRAKSKYGRNRYWKNTVNKYGYDINILIDGVDYKTAKQIEIYLISYYGRKDLGRGNLVNMTDGGEGYRNMNNEEKKKRSIRLSEYNKNTKDYSFTKDIKYKDKMRKSLLNKHNKSIIDKNNNTIIGSLNDASKYTGYSISYLSQMLNNKRINKTNLQWN
jgi:hypothetical protein